MFREEESRLLWCPERRNPGYFGVPRVVQEQEGGCTRWSRSREEGVPWVVVPGPGSAPYRTLLSCTRTPRVHSVLSAAGVTAVYAAGVGAVQERQPGLRHPERDRARTPRETTLPRVVTVLRAFFAGCPRRERAESGINQIARG